MTATLYRAITTLIRTTNTLANNLLPTTCLLCSSCLHGDLLCIGCELDLPHLSRAAYSCRQCALPLRSPADFCGQCLQKPPAFSHSAIPFNYQYPLDFLIHNFKYRRHFACGNALTQTLSSYLQHYYPENHLSWPDIIVPVPLHWWRRWQRGFNQTEIIGAGLEKALGIPLHTRLCYRHKRTPSQKGLSRAERQQNLRKAFALSTKSAPIIYGKTIALLDDVVTTTATARELSQLFIKHGAHDVHIWALARTPDTQ